MQGSMFGEPAQGLLFDVPPPAKEWTEESVSQALDELFLLAGHYRSSQTYFELAKFIAHFRFYSPYNAMLLHIQLPGATFVAPPSRWLDNYGRRIKPDARPLVILRPRGPVMFVFDISQTVPDPYAPPLPMDVVQPFEVRNGRIRGELEKTIDSAKRDGVRFIQRQEGSQSAGSIQETETGGLQEVLVRSLPKPEYVQIPVRYDVLINSALSREATYATLVHELAHLYCGHLGTPNERWWPNRRKLDHETREFEAESVCYLVCSRLGIDNPSEAYLAGYVGKHPEMPPISLEGVMKAAGLIEQMGRERLKPRRMS